MGIFIALAWVNTPSELIPIVSPLVKSIVIKPVNEGEDAMISFKSFSVFCFIISLAEN